MNVGDRVRLLKGREEGIISKIVNDKLIEVEIEDGFNIPVLKKEVVLISQQEASAFGKKPSQEPVSKKSEGPIAKSKTFPEFYQQYRIHSFVYPVGCNR